MVRNGFESRTLTNALTVVAIMDYLNDNLNDNPDDEELLQVTLTIEPRRVDRTDYCSRDEKEVKNIEVRNRKDVLAVGKFLLESLFIDTIHVAISKRKKDLVS